MDSSSTDAVVLVGRWRFDNVLTLLQIAEYTGDNASIRRTIYRRATLRGVPGKHVDMLIADRYSHSKPELSTAWVPVLELVNKKGRYDHAVRRRYAIRPFMRQEALALPMARLRIDESDPEWIEIMIVPVDTPAIVDRFPRLRSALDDYDLQRIAGWHWRRWFTHLTDEDGTRHACDCWAAEMRASGDADQWTLAEANRSASRMLYRLSRELGWRKLTAREREKLGMSADSPQWHKTDDLSAIYADRGNYNATGCGEATLTAAGQGHWPSLDDPATEIESLELEFDRAYSMKR